MKLIRLTSNDNNGLFDNTFNEDILIDEKSQIALHSFTAEIDTKEIVIDAQNNVILYKLFSGSSPSTPARVVNLTNAVYDASNYGSLLTDATVQMNKKINFANTELGLQWKVYTDKDKKVSFDVERGEYIMPEKSAFASKVEAVNVSSNTTGFYRSTDSSPNLDSFMWFKAPNCKGASAWRARIANTSAGGFILAYLAQPPPDDATEINTQSILYGIRVENSNSATKYKYYLNGVLNDSDTTNPLINDTFEIQTSHGEIKGIIYRDNEPLSAPIFTSSYDHMTDLFPVIIFIGDNSAKVNLIRLTADPFYGDNLVILNDEDAVEGIPTSGTTNPTVKMLGFEDIDLARIFGFIKTTYTSGSVDGYKFISENVFELADYSDSFVVELQNLNIESFDGLSSQHRNILNTIVQTETIKERLVFTAPYLLFLNINNANKISLRRLKARLLKEDLSAVSLTGFSQLSLVIKSQNE